MISATLDSSVWVRALHLGGPSATLIGHARMGNLRIDTSAPIINETMRVLRDKFGWPGELIHHTRGKLGELCNLASPAETLNIVKEDPDDNRIIECAVAAKSDYIVSEDKDLLRIGEYAGIKIVNVASFIEITAKHTRAL